MKYKVKTRYGVYNVDIKLKIRIELYLMYLRFKRIYKAIKRVFDYNRFLIISIMILFVIIGIVAILLYANKNINILNFFDKTVYVEIILTTIILPIMTNTFIKENERHKNLTIQYSIYSDIVYESITFIQNLLSNSIDWNIFFSEEKNAEFIKCVNNNYYNNINISKDAFQFYCNYYLDNIKYQISKSNIIIGKEEYNCSYQDLRNYISEELFKLNTSKINLDDKYIIKFINSIVMKMYLFIASYRRPWRWDKKIDNKIIKLLKEKSECEIGIDFKRDF